LSCEKNGRKFGVTAAAKNGISAVAGKAGNVAGAIRRAQGQAITSMAGKPASATLGVVNNFGMPASIDTLTPLASAAALVTSVRNPDRDRDEDKGPRPNIRTNVLNIVTAAQGIKAVSVGAGTGLARLSRNGSDGPVEQRNYFDRPQIRMRMYSSRLSPALNASDIRGWPVSVKRSGGKMYENRGQTWHAGTTTVETPTGEERTMTHLQSMNWPRTHYYFNRALRDDEVAGMIGQHHGFPAPRDVKGFLGEVSEVESLAPIVSRLKRGLIQAHAFFGDGGNRKG